jgi:hypothetical protein
LTAAFVRAALEVKYLHVGLDTDNPGVKKPPGQGGVNVRKANDLANMIHLF